MNEKLKRLATPEGVRDLLPDAAGQKRELDGKIQGLFSQWGYREVSTPAFEYSASFAEGMKEDLEDRVYRFLDERGRTLVLRPDFTAPLARVAATHLSRAPKPLRLCYGGNIYRYSSGQQGKQRELTQAGVELIGDGSAGSDAEIIALAAESLLALGLEEFTLCLGHIGFLDNLLSAYGLDAPGSETIKYLLSKKDFVSLGEMAAKLNLSSAAREAVMRVTCLRGGKETLCEAASLLPPGSSTGALTVLEEIWRVLEDYGITRFITVDLGLVRMMDYYTGMIFEGYTRGVGYPICGGGRYDQLLQHFGPDEPAVGFALNTDYLLAVLQRQKKLPAPPGLTFIAYADGNRAGAISAAITEREKKERVIVDTKPRGEEEAKHKAMQCGASRLLYYCGDNVHVSGPAGGKGVSS